MAASNRLLNCRFHHPDAVFRLICFPWAGGGSNFYSGWGKDLPDNIEVYGVMLAGREARFRDPPCYSYQEVIDSIASAIVTQLGDKPFIFFGHSMGALLSYETALLLKKIYGRQPVKMYLSGISAPHSESRRNKTLDFESVTDDDFVEHLKELGGTPPEILKDRQLLSLFIPALKADYTIVSQINYDKEEGLPALGCDFTFFDGADDDVHDYAAWKELTQGSFSLHKFPGGHFYLKDLDNKKKILNAITQDFPADLLLV